MQPRQARSLAPGGAARGPWSEHLGQTPEKDLGRRASVAGLDYVAVAKGK